MIDKHRLTYPDIKTEDMMSMYESGLSATQIAKHFGLEKSAVSRRLKKVGVVLRKSSQYEGENRYWLWKGVDYIDPITRKRNQRKHRQWSLAVRERDGHTCMKCGAEKVRLHAHHIVSIRQCFNTELAFEISNGITLCTKCHGLTHKQINNLTKA